MKRSAATFNQQGYYTSGFQQDGVVPGVNLLDQVAVEQHGENLVASLAKLAASLSAKHLLDLGEGGGVAVAAAHGRTACVLSSSAARARCQGGRLEAQAEEALACAEPEVAAAYALCASGVEAPEVVVP